MNLGRACFVSCLLSACATARLAEVEPGHPALVMEHHIAEGKGEGSDLPPKGAAAPTPVGASASASTLAPDAAPPAPPPLSGSQPDPEPLITKEQWEYQVLFSNGTASVEGAVRRSLPKPVATPRRMGRFALELWIGHELIDRVRFDFPMVAADDLPSKARRPLHDAPILAAHVTARVRVSLPASPRATRLMLIDRASEKAQELPWPPDRDGPVTAPVAVPPSAAQSPPTQ
ncbi:MAG: hypothetical protein ABW061_22260 [Polyangiaceae bacterium]